jgi:hypothetical protein
MKNLPLNTVQTQANDYLQETDLQEIFVHNEAGEKILIIHLLTDFYIHLKKEN